MADIKNINLFGTSYGLMDAGARATATDAVDKANQAIKALQNTTKVSYDEDTQSLVFEQGGNTA